nr:DUF2946 domain-containing protein [Pantoea sp. 201603H]
MVTLFRLSTRRLPALVGVWAILMLFVAPGVSKALEYWHLSGKGEATSHTMAAMGHMDRDTMAVSHHVMQTEHSASDRTLRNGGSNGHTAMPGTMSIMDDFACGYCQLLVHFPLLAWVFIPLIWLIRFSSPSPPSQIIPAYPVTFFAGILQPRAPPIA